MKLKTLEDLDKYEAEDFYWALEETGGSFNPEGGYISINKLKALAIKWMKEDKELLNILNKDEQRIWILSLKRWMERLNVKEEDFEVKG